MITNHQLFEFMQKLAADQRGKNPLMLTDWERYFLASFTASSRPTLWFTEGRRKSADRMWRKLGPELSFPHPLDTVTERPKLAAADPTGCEYLVREDGRQSRCNAEAEYQELGKLRYCRPHAEAVEKECKRANIRIALIKFP